MAAAKPKPKFEVRSYTTHKNPAAASPSASIILVSPTNEILLLHRVKSSSAFPSAHVFPGGNLDPQDGELPPDPKDPARHKDSIAYRTGAIRELFEETGILLAKESASATSLLSVSPEDRLAGRQAVHSGKISFKDWLASQSKDAVLHTDGLIPFTHWVTPPNVPKRFTTQMYLYYIHLKETSNPSINATADQIETMDPQYHSAAHWLSLARASSIILFPPQFLLLHLASRFLDSPTTKPPGTKEIYGEKINALEIVQRRRELYNFVMKEGKPVPWSEKFISPIGKGVGKDGRQTLTLAKPGPELEGSGLRGDEEYVVMVKFSKEGPRQLDVKTVGEVREEAKQAKL